jgi:two-component system OmpR family sensor kinase
LTLRARLTVFYTVVLLVIVTLFGADVWWVEGRIGLRRVDRELEALSSTLVTLVNGELAEASTLQSAAGEAARSVAASGHAIAVIDSEGRLMVATWDDFDWTGAVPRAPTDLAVGTYQTSRGPWRLRLQRRQFGNARAWLAVASSLRDVERQQHEVVETLWLVIPLVLAVAGGGGWWIATLALSPISHMARETLSMTASGDDTLADADRRDELGAFARAFNGLLARVRGALRTQRQFMADASHELRTPITVIRAASDVALSQPVRDEREYRDALTITGDQARRLSRLVDHMLVLARADAGGYAMQRGDLYLDELVDQCCRAVGVLCQEGRVTLQKGRWTEIPFRGDERLLEQLVLNVLQNAVQHTPPGGIVSVDVSLSEQQISIVIVDSGAGIPPEDRERVFERFVRLDPARTGGGAGLGLPIARWIAKAHGGTLTLEQSGPAGSTFSISLPQDCR